MCRRSPALSLAEMTLLLQCGKQRLISSCAEVPLICPRCLGKAQGDFFNSFESSLRIDGVEPGSCQSLWVWGLFQGGI